ncbi:beta-glucuronidase [Copidosoma floridanum]|uniref:beta-glucuronidase n=1 Tax=Copidosoma floridanum TaxID=29053 RepID=UPI0006C9814E|nr:beta-glucuronidase [Copidosoma floridanum]
MWLLRSLLVAATAGSLVAGSEIEIRPSGIPIEAVIDNFAAPATVTIAAPISITTEKPVMPLPGLLYPRESESREIKSLDGFWDFAVPSVNDPQKGLREMWYAEDLSKVAKVMQMPVPSSYNDITTSSELRDYVGPVWYEKTFFVPQSWRDKRVFLRFGSVNYLAQVWLNGELLTNHEMGHLPFEAEITKMAMFGEKNRVTVAVDNGLSQTSVPQGKIAKAEADNGTVRVQSYTFDFFNYAGIHRPVLLHTKPRVFVEDIDIDTGVVSEVGVIKYSLKVAGLRDKEMPLCEVRVLDAEEQYVTSEPSVGTHGVLKIKSPHLWWPRSMSDKPGYMYTMEVKVKLPNVTEHDIYRLPVGIRTLRWTNTSFFINDKPIYFRGFGRHEDSAIRGRGLDLVTTARDYELLQWVGANAYRTSHYPYSDEVLDLADKLGFMIIDECPSVDTENFSSELLHRHKLSLSELIRRDKNRPSVVMWSIANEPRTQLADAGIYFEKVAYHTKSLDRTRPITIALARSVTEDKAGQYLDIISFNRYNAWYSNTGRLDMITNRVMSEAQAWHDKYNKPVLMSEYGADTMPGLHELPEYVWSEEYQLKTMSRHFEAFDQLRAEGFFIGEFIWNFADFRTAQTYTRVGGNKKGIFTRDRQPKLVAHHVRRRYHALSAEEDSGAELPCNLENYISSSYNF